MVENWAGCPIEEGSTLMGVKLVMAVSGEVVGDSGGGEAGKRGAAESEALRVVIVNFTVEVE